MSNKNIFIKNNYKTIIIIFFIILVFIICYTWIFPSTPANKITSSSFNAIGNNNTNNLAQSSATNKLINNIAQSSITNKLINNSALLFTNNNLINNLELLFTNNNLQLPILEPFTVNNNVVPSSMTSNVTPYILSPSHTSNNIVIRNSPYYALYQFLDETLPKFLKITQDPINTHHSTIYINLPIFATNLNNTPIMNLYNKIIKSGIIEYISSALNTLQQQQLYSDNYLMLTNQIKKIINIISDINTKMLIIFTIYSNFVSNSIQNINPIITDIFNKISMDPFVIKAYQQILLEPFFANSIKKINTNNTLIQNLLIIISDYIKIQQTSTQLIIDINIPKINMFDTNSISSDAIQNIINILSDAIQNIYNILINSQILLFIKTTIDKLITTTIDVISSDDYIKICYQIINIIDIINDKTTVNSIINLIKLLLPILSDSTNDPVFKKIVEQIFANDSVKLAIDQLLTDPYIRAFHVGPVGPMIIEENEPTIIDNQPYLNKNTPYQI